MCVVPLVLEMGVLNTVNKHGSPGVLRYLPTRYNAHHDRYVYIANDVMAERASGLSPAACSVVSPSWPPTYAVFFFLFSLCPLKLRASFFPFLLLVIAAHVRLLGRLISFCFQVVY